MKSILILGLLFSLSNADYLKQTSLGCPSMEAIKNAPRDAGESGLDITFYSMANSCVIINTKDKIKAIDYKLDSKAAFQAIKYKKTGQKLYVLRKNVVFEQGGSKNIFKF